MRRSKGGDPTISEELLAREEQSKKIKVNTDYCIDQLTDLHVRFCYVHLIHKDKVDSTVDFTNGAGEGPRPRFNPVLTDIYMHFVRLPCWIW